jgi:hypothetical protein
MKHNFRDFVNFPFLGALDSENEIAWPLVTFKHRFTHFAIVANTISKQQNISSHGLLETLLPLRCPSSFFDAEDAENDFVRPFDTLNHRFIDFVKVVF